MARPKGSKNKPRSISLVSAKALREMDNEFIESAYKILLSDPNNIPKPKTAMEQLFMSVYTRAIDPEDKTSHQHAKLIMERVIPQRKQVEHLGEQDAHRLGVNINVITEKANEREPIEHESIGGSEPHRPELEGGRVEEQSETEPESRTDPESPKRVLTIR